jgi:regulator of sigma E protease
MEGIIMAAQLILGLSILVGIHEFGHLIAAKIFGMRVEKYSIGFPPRVWGFKWGDTEYSIGAIPLGGFVKISGMVDESLDIEEMGKDPEPWEFRAKPAWQRLIVMLGGIIFNVITGIVIFAMINFGYGKNFLDKNVANTYGIYAYPLAKKMGLQNGDKILKLNGKDFENFADVQSGSFLINENPQVTALRGGQTLTLSAPQGLLSEKIEKKGEPFADALEPFRVEQVTLGSNADKGGLKNGDRFLTVNGDSVPFIQDFLSKMKTLKGETADFEIIRGEEVVHLEIPVTEQGKIGFAFKGTLERSTLEYGFFESFPEGASQAYRVLSDNVKGFKKIIFGDIPASQAVSGPIGIATFFGGTWIWQKFWYITGLLSLILAFMNLLPIPALDGGHVVFLIFEMLTGKTLPIKVMAIAQKTGMAILLVLMAFVIFNDIVKLFY